MKRPNRFITVTAVTIPAVVSLVLASSAASASDLCNVPENERQPVEALQQKLESEGWSVRNIKLDDGCYEAYATNPEGERVEAYFDPKTFELIKSDVD